MVGDRCLLFDLDGTLADTLPGLKEALNRTLAAAGRAPADDAEVKSWVGDGVAKLVERAFDARGGQAGGVLARFTGFYAETAVAGSRAFPGAVAALRELRQAGFRLGVCTNKPTAAAESILSALGMRGFLDGVTGADRAAARKPDPAHVWAALRDAGGDARQAVMVGDGENDVAAGHAAGLPVVLVSFGYAHRPVEELGAEAVIGDFEELAGVVRRLVGG